MTSMFSSINGDNQSEFEILKDEWFIIPLTPIDFNGSLCHIFQKSLAIHLRWFSKTTKFSLDICQSFVFSATESNVYFCLTYLYFCLFEMFPVSLSIFHNEYQIQIVNFRQAFMLHWTNLFECIKVEKEAERFVKYAI